MTYHVLTTINKQGPWLSWLRVLRVLRGSSLYFIWLAVILSAQSALAQTAPAGNAHPTPVEISEVDATNPFGEPLPESPFSVAQKREFSRAVDLAPLRDLAVQNSGRTKILDTLAHESVSHICGRKNFLDYERVGDKSANGEEKIKKVAYEPLFTMLDMAIDPAYYADKALLHVEYLPLRELFLVHIFPLSSPDIDEEALTEAQKADPAVQAQIAANRQIKQTRERWKRVGRLRPMDVAMTAAEVQADMPVDQQYYGAFQKLSLRAERFQFGWRNLLMLAPDSEHRNWAHLSTAPADSPIRKACLELGEAWRAGDAARANAAIKTLATEIPKINAGSYPTTSRQVEALYNTSHPFEWGYWLYFLALLTLLLGFGTGRKGLTQAGLAVFVLAVAMHAFGFGTRCVIAERFAIQNQFESMTGLSLFGAIVALALAAFLRQPIYAAAGAGLGFLALIGATQTGIPGGEIEREAAILNTSVLLKYHVTTVLVSYGLITLGFMCSLFYLGTYYASRARRAAGVSRGVSPREGDANDVSTHLSASALGIDDPAQLKAGSARVLHDLDRATMIVLQLAFWTLGVGILLGAWWADHSWGRWWAFDPKELWALVTWIVYLIVIHLRFAQIKNKALVTAWLSVAGFVVMLWTYFGVNLLLPGLHAYA